MEEAAEPEKQQRMITGSSIKRKPFLNLTNLIPKPYHHSSSFSQSRKPKSAASAADSGISGSTDASTQNPNHVQHPSTVPRDQHAPRSTLRTPSPACSRRQTMLKTRSKTKATAAPVYPTSLENTKNDKKARPVPLRCSTLENIKVKEKGIALPINRPSLENDRKEVAVALHCSSAEKIKDKGKAIAVPVISPPMKKSTNKMEDVHMPLSGVKIHDKGKAVAVPLRCPPMKKVLNSIKDIPMLHSTEKMNDKEISVLLRYPPMENTNNMEYFPVSQLGLKIVGSSVVDLSKKYKEKVVATPINHGALEKKGKESSCLPPLRTRSNRNEVDGAEDALQSKSLTDPLPNNRKRRCSTKGSSKEYVLPQDFINQQRAYFKEIDEYELEVEEVSI